RHYRDRKGLYFVEGVRSFVTAVEQGCQVDNLLYSERLLTSPPARKLVRNLKRAGIPFTRLTPEEFRSISRSERASGVGVILRQHILKLEEVAPGKYPCWIALDRVRAPGNFGTLVRSSAAVGAAGFLLLGDGIDPFDPAVVRASMGAFFRQTFVRTTPQKLSEWAGQHGLLIVGASPDGSLAYNRVAYTRPTILVLGEERGGLTAEQRALCHKLVRIPMVAESDSLNLGVAGSLLMYQVLRQGNSTF
ncbi:MAG TPA: RNA methyltransferase, partial [Chloroflexia bacterium]|nr:RNA methyltransferase [Chloroflexia bacterium]